MIEEILKKPLISERVLLVGEGKIPGEVLEKINDNHLKIFLREPDPHLWPSEISHLVRYLPEEEQLKWKVSGILRKHDDVIIGALEKWLEATEEEIS